MRQKEGKTPRVVVVMPAYNAAKTLKKTYHDLPHQLIHKVIVVDDASSDDTSKIASSLRLEVQTHAENLGYGGNQKTCYTLALQAGADIIVMLHPDYQYDATLIPDLIKPISDDRADIMLGSRIRSRREALEGGMPLYKYVSNRTLTIFENIVFGLSLSEYHTGFRAFARRALTRIPFQKLSNDFVFDQQIIFEAIARGFRIGEIAVPVRYFEEASSINFSRSLWYGLSTVYHSLRYAAKGRYQ